MIKYFQFLNISDSNLKSWNKLWYRDSMLRMRLSTFIMKKNGDQEVDQEKDILTQPTLFGKYEMQKITRL